MRWLTLPEKVRTDLAALARRGVETSWGAPPTLPFWSEDYADAWVTLHRTAQGEPIKAADIVAEAAIRGVDDLIGFARTMRAMDVEFFACRARDQAAEERAHERRARHKKE